MTVLDRAFALAYDPATRLAERRLGRHRRYLAAGLEGRVLDLGCGTGRQFPALAALGDAVEVVGVDPDEHMRRRARRRAADLDLDVRIEGDRGESLPFADGAFDAVVLGMVLCSVDEPGTVLEEIERVLRPGGELRLLEHVHDDGRTGRLQRLVEPAWRPIAGGCHLTRRSGALVAGRDRLDVLELERFDPGFPLVRPFVRGRLRRRRDGAHTTSTIR